MFERFKTPRQKITLDKFGPITLIREGKDHFWFGRVKNIFPHSEVELTINVVDKNQSLTSQTKLIADMANNYDGLMTMLFDYMQSSFAANGHQKTIEELKEMYFLCAIELKKDNKDWWIVLEPSWHVEPIYDFFLRFTVRDGGVTWSNV